MGVQNPIPETSAGKLSWEQNFICSKQEQNCKHEANNIVNTHLNYRVLGMILFETATPNAKGYFTSAAYESCLLAFSIVLAFSSLAFRVQDAISAFLDP